TEIKNVFETTMAKQHNQIMNILTNLTMQRQSPSGSGLLPSNTVANPRGDLKAMTTQSGVVYDGPMIPPTLSPLPKEVEHEIKVTKDKVQATIYYYILTNLTMQRQSPSGSGLLPSNTVANPRGDLKAITTQSGVVYDGPMIPPTLSPLPKEVEHEIKVTKDKVQATSSESTAHVQTPVVQDPILEPEVALKPNTKPSIPYPLRLNDQKLHEKDNNQILKLGFVIKCSQ
nr:reverse transcriptase domain-containing protein [Tanacetum cinerariifolium]